MVSLKFAALAGVFIGASSPRAALTQASAHAARIPRQDPQCGKICTADEICDTDGYCKPRSCPAGEAVCEMFIDDWRCRDLQMDPLNCGACQNVCGQQGVGAVCVAGACHDCPDLFCPTGGFGGVCADRSTDAAHCGACDNACADGESCVGGVCTAPACPTGQETCDGTCADTQTDTNNCGYCGNVCAADKTCRDGWCQPAACPEGETVCQILYDDWRCRDLQTDPTNCGACQNICGPAGDGVCVAGVCVTCPDRFCPSAGGFGGVCANITSDFDHCGDCYSPCEKGQTCVGGVCTGTAGSCPPGQKVCGGECADTGNDNRHCGGCGSQCGAGQNCVQGECVGSFSPCGPGQAWCAGGCVNPQNDNSHCGRCGAQCAAGKNCSGGKCV